MRAKPFLPVCLSTLIIFTISFKGNCTLYNANQNNYSGIVGNLVAGDTLLLQGGNYTNGLYVGGLTGTALAPIVIMGTENGTPTTFLGNGCCNTISLVQSAYVVLKNLTINGQNIPNIDGVKAEGSTGNWTHHITLENLRIIGHGANQQTVGISTKCTSWDWAIRGCSIEAAGTGMYLGNSNGNDPFVNGLIEHNLIFNTIGYNMQIKHQNNNLRVFPGMTLNGKTVIRYNVFSKAQNASTGGDARPNLLLGNFPATGNGSNDVYEIYGNFLYQNPVERLLQGTGNIALYNNIFVNHIGGDGAGFQTHNGFQPRDIFVFQNTFLINGGTGINFSGVNTGFTQMAVGNAVFAANPINNSPVQSNNVTGSYAASVNFVNSASTNLASLDLYPLPGMLTGTAINSAPFQSFENYDLDFNGDQKDWMHRGGYSGNGTNQGWHLAIAIRPPVLGATCLPPDGMSTGPLTPNSARLNWNAVSGADHYKIRGRRVGATNWTVIDIPSGATTSKNVFGLSNNTDYEWQMITYCDAAETLVSQWSALNTFTAGCYAPDTMWASPVTSNGARLNWVATPGAAGFEIKGRRVGGGLATITVGSSATSRDVFGLLPGTTYEWTIRSLCNQAGTLPSAFTPMDTFVTQNVARFALTNLNDIEENISIYPNPFSNQVSIEYTNPQTGKYAIRILDTGGVLVFERQNITGSKTIFNRKGLSAGAYIVEIIDEGVLRKKLLVQ